MLVEPVSCVLVTVDWKVLMFGWVAATVPMLLSGRDVSVGGGGRRGGVPWLGESPVTLVWRRVRAHEL